MLDSERYRELQSILRPMVPLYSENARLLNEAGVLLLAATDVGIPAVIPGISLHEELELLVEAGTGFWPRSKRWTSSVRTKSSRDEPAA